jgi:hypothetical protein
MGESYTPLMAKRFNVSIPDALAERLEPHKNRISLSAVMQAALERELAQLNLSDEDKQRRASLKAVATEAWLRRNPIIRECVSVYVDHLYDQAINDGIDRLFYFYRQLSLKYREDELVRKILSNHYYHQFTRCKEKDPECLAREVIKNASEVYGSRDGFEEFFSESFTWHLLDRVMRKDIVMPEHLLDGAIEDHDVETDGYYLFTNEFLSLIQSHTAQELALRIMESKLRADLDEKAIDSFILDFEGAFAMVEMDSIRDGDVETGGQ